MKLRGLRSCGVVIGTGGLARAGPSATLAGDARARSADVGA